MEKCIKVRRNSDNRYLIKLYGKVFDLTDKVLLNPKGSLVAFGTSYDYEAILENDYRKNMSAKLKAKKETQDEAQHY